MKKSIKFSLSLGILVFAVAALILYPPQIWAAQVVDADADGFLDVEEEGLFLPQNLYMVCAYCIDAAGACVPCNGATSNSGSYDYPYIKEGVNPPNGGASFVPSCSDQNYIATWGGDEIPRNLCMDANSQDIFVILYPAYVRCNADEADCNPLYDSDLDGANDSNIAPSKEFATSGVYDPLYLIGSLGVTPHQLVDTGAITRTVGFTQNAVLAFEDLTPRGLEEKGNSTIGTPNGLGIANIFTEFIKNSVEDDCALAKEGECKDSTSDLNVPLLISHRHFQDTFAHEVGHLMALLFSDPAFKKFKVEDNHLTINGYMMEAEPNVVINTRKKTVSYEIPTGWSDISKGTHILNQ